jgi:two-component system OmpR family response regulator
MRILLLDDEPQVRAVVTACLSREGYEVVAPEVEQADLSTAAVRQALFGSYDLLLIDLRLPHLDTLTFLRNLRISRPATPVVVVAGFLRSDVRSRLEALEVKALIEKPFTFDQLRVEVRRHLPVHAS